LNRHPRLRVYVMHAGWPMGDRMIQMLYTYPQLYVDTGVIDWCLPRREFHHYLQRLVDAGFASRIMFGTDQMVWPQMIEVAVESIRSATFLTKEQKRDIFYNNAARFFRFSALASPR
jgi:predicted TIM-barrel fold metal-dependent hydrolase